MLMGVNVNIFNLEKFIQRSSHQNAKFAPMEIPLCVYVTAILRNQCLSCSRVTSKYKFDGMDGAECGI